MEEVQKVVATESSQLASTDGSSFSFEIDPAGGTTF